ncbi:MAG: hypothetical protein EOO39_17460, partial [Cytophagaceae bacterium]
MLSNDRISLSRNSQMEFGQVYFWTNTIHQWRRLLVLEKYKQLIINCWRELVNRQQVAVYAFVIMPNHVHVIWEMLAPNGKEMPHASFNKFMSHQLLADLRAFHPQ